MSRKVAYIGVCIAALSLSACGTPTPSASKNTLVVAGYGGSYQEAFEKSVVPEFEKSCDCKVTYIAGSSVDTIAKLKAQRANPQIDVALIDDGPQAQAVSDGLLAPLDPKTVTNLSNIDSLARLPKDVGAGFSLNATGIAYNADWYAKNGLPAPKSLADLAHPKLKGKVVLPSITNTYGVGLLMMGAKANGGSERQPQPGFDFAHKLAANTFTFDTSADVSNYFLQGQAVASVWGNARVQNLASQDFPVKFVYPREKAALLLATANVVNKAPHAELAQKFVNTLLSADAQEKLAAAAYAGPTAKDAHLDKALAAKVTGPDQVAKLQQLDWTTINQRRSAWTDQWNKQVETQ
ncbi:ABC transporter substrate-binding protein [Streptomyces sp. NPDC049597]|uniref:ABC transporter substrate-binding protein n=1 Tax=Streptomyces sp. NPDC049597 TaxID=3155276 RepID=UPI003438DC25